MPGYVIMGAVKLIRSPIKKTRLWAQKKVSEMIKKRREKGKAGLTGEEAWMSFGEQVLRHDLIPIFDENLRGLATAQDLTVPSSELAIHQRAAGFHIQAFAWDKPLGIAYAVYQPSDRSFGYLAGLEHEVLPVSLTALVERTFGKEYPMKSGAAGDSERQTGIADAVVAGAAAGTVAPFITDYIRSRRSKTPQHATGATWEAFEKRIKEMLPIEKRHKGLQELSDADLGPVYDHILLHINEYKTIADVPKPLLILAKRYVRAHSELLKNIPIERVYEQYGAIMGGIIEMEMMQGYAISTGARSLSPKPVPVYTEQRLLGIDELVFKSRPYKDMRDMPPDLVRAIKNYVRTHPEDLKEMTDREMVMRFGWGFYHAAEPEIAAVQGSTMRRHGRVDLAGREEAARHGPEWSRFVRESATNRIVERYRTAQRENWSRDVSAAFTPSEVQEAVGDFIYLTEGTAFAIQDLNRIELENALEGLNIQLEAR